MLCGVVTLKNGRMWGMRGSGDLWTSCAEGHAYFTYKIIKAAGTSRVGRHANFFRLAGPNVPPEYRKSLIEFYYEYKITNSSFLNDSLFSRNSSARLSDCDFLSLIFLLLRLVENYECIDFEGESRNLEIFIRNFGYHAVSSRPNFQI